MQIIARHCECLLQRKQKWASFEIAIVDNVQILMALRAKCMVETGLCDFQ